jgi:ADP-ribose pyrophosphatase
MERLYSNSPIPGSVMPWSKTGEEVKLAGKFGVNLISQGFTNPKTGEVDQYVFCRKGLGFTVVPVLVNGNMVVTRTFKHGVNRVVWEFPAGMKMSNQEKGTPFDLAKVELSEESGLRAGKVVYLGTTSTAPRKIDTAEHLYLALGCTVLEQGPTPEKNEILEVWELSIEELWGLIRLHDGSFSGFSEMAAMRAADLGLIRKP